ncbi:glycine-rich domain-containing protein, partial [Rhizobium flavescens]
MQLLSSYLASSTSLSTPREWRIFTVSRTYTPDQDIDVILHLIGAGAQGGFIQNTMNATLGLLSATGGGSGAYVKKRVTLKAGVTYTFTIGAGGWAVALTPSTAGQSNGADGGNTTVTGGGLNLIAGGGKGGNTANTVTAATLGGLGGIASGGDVNRDGNRGGNIGAGTGTPTGYLLRATGGGGVNLLGEGGRGGDIPANGPYNGSSITQMTGGGGLGQNAQDAPVSTASTGALYGGGVGSLVNSALTTAYTLLSRAFLGFWQTFGPIQTSGTAGPGCGAGNGGGAAGDFGGGASYPMPSTGIGMINGPAAGIGAGSGGVVAAISGNSARAAKGGDGLIIMEVLS